MFIGFCMAFFFTFLNPNFVQVALEEINDLPEFMHACTMTYVPQVGYMLVVDPWDENETVTEETEAIQGLPDMDFLFCAGGVPHFKTRRSAPQLAMNF